MERRRLQMLEHLDALSGCVPLTTGERFLEAGVHIGALQATPPMRAFVYRRRSDGLNVLNLKLVEERVACAARLLARFERGRVVAVAVKDTAQAPVKHFCALTGAQPIIGRFVPGRFTNPAREDFLEPLALLVSDPAYDRQALKEAQAASIVTIALCDTNNRARGVDLIVPTNNKGRKALALIYWLLARELLLTRGEIASADAFTAKPEDFEV